MLFLSTLLYTHAHPQLDQHIQRWFPATLPCGAFNQIAAPRIHHPNSAVDICAIIQSAAVRLLADCHALFHLRDHRNAGIFPTAQHTFFIMHTSLPRITQTNM